MAASMCASSSSNRTTFIIIALLLLSLPPRTRAQRADFDVPQWARNRYYWGSSRSPILEILRTSRDFVASTETLTRHVEHVEEALQRRFAAGGRFAHNGSSAVCANYLGGTGTDKQFYRRYRPMSRQLFGLRGWAAPHGDCLSELFNDEPVAGTPALFSSARLRRAMMTMNAEEHALRERIVDNAARNGSGLPLLRDWDRGPRTRDTHPRFRFKDVDCVTEGRGAVRVGKHWYFSVSVFNNPSRVGPRTSQRLSEFIHFPRKGDGPPHTAVMRVTEYAPLDLNDTKTVVHSNTTTMLEISPFERNLLQTVPYSMSFFVSRALRSSSFATAAVQRALEATRPGRDTLTATTLSLLVLPIFFNLIPSVLLMHMITDRMLVLIVISDVLAVLPLGVKGAELIYISSLRPVTVTTTMQTGTDGMAGDGAIAEVWMLQCRDPSNMLPNGIALVVTSVFCLVSSIIVEVRMRKYLQQRYQKIRSYGGKIKATEHYDDAAYLQSLMFYSS